MKSVCRSHNGNSDDDRTSNSITVVENFHDLGTQVIQRIGDVEAIRIVEGFVARVHPGGVPAKSLWPSGLQFCSQYCQIQKAC